MAGLTTKNTINYEGEYFPEEKWPFYQQELSDARRICKNLSKKYRWKLFQDSRWPATGIVKKKLIKSTYITICLNSEYLGNQKDYYELRIFQTFSIPIFYSRIIYSKLVKIYDDIVILSSGVKRSGIL